MDPTLVLTDLEVLTMLTPRARAEAIALRAGRILAIGDRHAVLEAAGPGARTLALPGRAVLPGFIDAHHHLWPAIFYANGVGLASVRTLDELFARVREAARSVPPGGFVIAHGYDPWLLAERRHPTRAELDAVCPEHPLLVIEYSFHEGVANSAALARAGWSRDTQPPQGGALGRDRKGELNGHVIESALLMLEAVARMEIAPRDAERALHDLAGYQQRLFARGITRLCDAAVPPECEALYERALAERRLRIPIVMLPTGSRGIGLAPGARLEGRPTGEGSDLLRVGPLKLVFDGATRCAMCMSVGQIAWAAGQTLAQSAAQRSLSPLRQGLALKLRWGRDLRARTGERYYQPEAARQVVRAARERGFTLAIHAIGNEAVACALDALAAADGGGAPCRIEHATVIDRQQARRAADLGVMVVMQADFVRLPVFESLPVPPPYRAIAARTLLDAGVVIAGSSDAPVSDFDPLDGVRSAVRRLTRSGVAVQPDEAISVFEALASYTRDAARACSSSATTGTLEVGKRADLVVLNRDPLALGPSELDQLRVERTYLAGECVYQPDAPPS